MAYTGDKCKNAELRAQNKNDTCKHIHNDKSAVTLLWIGVILAIPLQLVAIVCSFYCVCFCLAAMLEDSGSSNRVGPSGAGEAFVIGALIGFSDWLQQHCTGSTTLGWMLSMPFLTYYTLYLARIHPNRVAAYSAVLTVKYVLHRIDRGNKRNRRISITWEMFHWLKICILEEQIKYVCRTLQKS